MAAIAELQREVEARLRSAEPLAQIEHDVDHLPGGVRASVTLTKRRPQLVKAAGPRPPVALLAKRD